MINAARQHARADAAPRRRVLGMERRQSNSSSITAPSSMRKTIGAKRLIDSALGKAGGNSRGGQRIDVHEDTAALLEKLMAAAAK